MKALDIAILLAFGFAIWILGTIYYASRGPLFSKPPPSATGAPLHYRQSSQAFCASRSCVGGNPRCSLGLRHVLLALPGMIGEALVLSHLSTFMPKLQAGSGGRYGALLLLRMRSSWESRIVTLRATG